MQPHKHRLLNTGVPRPGVCALLMALAWPSLGVAHELEDEAVPDMPGWRLSAGVALSAIHANQAWPTPRHAGVLLTGEQARDRSGELGLEHAMLGVGLRANGHWSAQWALGQHDRDAPHVEVARVQGEWTVGWWQPGEQLRWRLGRQTVPLGAVIGQAGQLDAFAQAPLAKQAVMNTTWVDDGSSLQWQAAASDAIAPRLSQVELGVWRARKFPAGPHGAVAPSLRLQGQWGHWRADVGAVWLHPEGRGAAVQGVGVVGHSHGVPDCRVSMAQRICFDGQAQVVAASLATDSDDGRWTLQAAGLWRRERGDLSSVNGRAAYAGDTNGMWLQGQWRWLPTWLWAARLEHLQTRHDLHGPGASLLATEAGFNGARPVSRAALSLGYSGWSPVQLWVEAGQERAASTQPYAALRLLWQGPRLLKGGW